MNLLIENHKLGVDIYESKRSLFEMFYGAFYDFILTHGGKEDLLSHNIKSKEDFFDYADYYADGKDNCYAIGFAFSKYFLENKRGGKLEEQPDTKFIGYCHKNGMFTDFLNFLISYFAYWRNDEGCTSFDPYNYADDFFANAWATLVDTSKLFYFTAETVYHWHSFRIKYILDNIPGVVLKYKENSIEPLRVAGYEFKGWFMNEKDTEPLTEAKEGMKARLVRKDTYNYWENEEKTIKKVYVKDMPCCDPM